MIAIWKNLKKRFVVHLHPIHSFAHLSYFGAVAIEGHGNYALIAGGLFFITLATIISGEE